MINLHNRHLIRTKTSKKRGTGIVNALINKLPVELHIPGFNFCGPGTKLKERLARGDTGVNLLDEACKEHDIAYNERKDLQSRHEADKVLASKALARFKASDSGIGEKIAALGISGAMNVKTKLGMGLRKKRKTGRGLRGGNKKITLNRAILNVKKGLIGQKFKNLKSSAKYALALAKKDGKISPPKKRIIPIPKSGGFLPLIPLFAGLSALGALGGGAAGIAKAVNDAKTASQKLEEAKRHNETMEAIALGKKGSGLYLKPYKSGCGLYLKPYSKNC